MISLNILNKNQYKHICMYDYTSHVRGATYALKDGPTSLSNNLGDSKN